MIHSQKLPRDKNIFNELELIFIDILDILLLIEIR